MVVPFPLHPDAHAPACWPGRFIVLMEEGENDRTSVALADNANAAECESRFHGLLYEE